MKRLTCLSLVYRWWRWKVLGLESEIDGERCCNEVDKSKSFTPKTQTPSYSKFALFYCNKNEKITLDKSKSIRFGSGVKRYSSLCVKYVYMNLPESAYNERWGFRSFIDGGVRRQGEWWTEGGTIDGGWNGKLGFERERWIRVWETEHSGEDGESSCLGFRRHEEPNFPAGT